MRDEPFLPNRRSVRLPHFDYAQPGAYFLTICVRDRRPLFGKLAGHRVELNLLGRVAEECWLQIPAHFSVIRLGPHVVMPDHLHGIIRITAPRPSRSTIEVDGAIPAKDDRRARYIVPLREKPARDFAESVAGSIATIVSTFKAAVSRKASRNVAPLWQCGYYEHVIRDERDFQNACEYIQMNPARRTFEIEYWKSRAEKR